MTTRNVLMKRWTQPCLIPFFMRSMKTLSRPDGSLLYGKLGFELISNRELVYANTEVRLRLIIADLNLTKLVTTPTLVLEIFNVRFAIVTLPPRIIIMRIDVIENTPVAFHILDIPARTFIIPSIRNPFIQENIFNDAPVSRGAIAKVNNSANT